MNQILIGAHDVPAEFLLPQATSTRSSKVISADLIRPFPRSLKGNQYVLVVSHNFSKISVVYPLRKATAQVVAKHIEEDVFFFVRSA